MGAVLDGRALFQKILERPQSLFDRVWQIVVSEGQSHTPEGRAAIKMRLLELSATIRHPDVRAQYRNMFLERYDATFFAPRTIRPPQAARPRPTLVDMKAFVASRNVPDDKMALLTKLSHVENDLAEATRLLGENFTESGFNYQQDLLEMKADIQRQIVGDD